MSDETRDVEVLADWMLQHADKAFPWPGELEELMADDLARAILASDWLAEHDAELEARVLREAADAVSDECTHLQVACFCGSADWLRERADRIGSA